MYVSLVTHSVQPTTPYYHTVAVLLQGPFYLQKAHDTRRNIKPQVPLKRVSRL